MSPEASAAVAAGFANIFRLAAFVLLIEVWVKLLQAGFAAAVLADPGNPDLRRLYLMLVAVGFVVIFFALYRVG